MINEDAEIQAPRTRRAEDGIIEGTNQPDSKGGTTELGGQPEYLRIGDLRALGARAIGGLVGGILSRMMEDKRDRIREAEECIEWYEREKAKRLAELTELEQLVLQIQDEPVSE